MQAVYRHSNVAPGEVEVSNGEEALLNKCPFVGNFEKFFTSPFYFR